MVKIVLSVDLANNPLYKTPPPGLLSGQTQRPLLSFIEQQQKQTLSLLPTHELARTIVHYVRLMQHTHQAWRALTWAENTST